jgi:hypothetical protein
MGVYIYIYIMAFLYSRVAPFSLTGCLFYSFLSMGFRMHSGRISCSGVPYVFDAVGSLPVVSLFFFFLINPFYLYRGQTVKRAFSIYVAGRTPLFLYTVPLHPVSSILHGRFSFVLRANHVLGAIVLFLCVLMYLFLLYRCVNFSI